MKMKRGTPRVARSSDVPEHIAGLHDVAGTNVREAIQMGVVVRFESRPQHPHDLAAERIGADTGDQASRRTQYGRVPWGKDVDPFVTAAIRPRCGPRVDDLPGRRQRDRRRQARRRLVGREPEEKHHPIDGGTPEAGARYRGETQHGKYDDSSLHGVRIDCTHDDR